MMAPRDDDNNDLQARSMSGVNTPVGVVSEARSASIGHVFDRNSEQLQLTYRLT